MIDPAAMRRPYYAPPLEPGDLDPDPVEQFQAWFAAAVERQETEAEANAMTLATTDPDGRPAGRMVLLRGVDERGWAFFTSYESRKGRHLAANPYAALVFYWALWPRQVTVTGRVERLPEAESDAYFATRPRGSQISAWASAQSQVLADRAALERAVAEAEARFTGARQVPRPPHWGGFLVVPDEVEFWQGRPDRRHDRVRYRRDQDGWLRERLAP